MKRRPRVWMIAAVGTLVALISLALPMRSEEAVGSAGASPQPGADVAVGAGAAQPVVLEGGASSHDGALETDELWRLRMNRIDRRARSELGLDDTTAQRLDALQHKLRLLVQDARDQLGIGGLTREQVETRIHQRTGGFRSQVGKLLGSRAKTYLRIVQESRTGS